MRKPRHPREQSHTAASFTAEGAMSGHVGCLSPSQERTLAQFRESVCDLLPVLPSSDDYFLLRWLRARSFDLQKSELMLRKHVEFRKQQDLDHILEWQPPEVVQLFHASGLCGHDREGCPVWYHIIRGLDPKGLALAVSTQDMLRHKLQGCEQLLQECERQSHQRGKKVEQIIAIFDFDGFGLRHLSRPAVEFTQKFFMVLEANYPEVLKHFIVLRAPRLFPVAYNLVKAYLSEETRKKVLILGGDWKQELTKFISPDQLPMEFGGTMTDPDGNPKCLTKINYGGDVPLSYRRQSQERPQYEHSASVGRGSSLQLEHEVLFPGCVLRWQFASEGADIGFGISLKTRAGHMVEVLPSQRYNAHLVPEDGSLTCDRAGVYVLRFDNTYSRLHAKRVSYSVALLLPDPGSLEKIERL